jgi:hypothetical protein
MRCSMIAVTSAAIMMIAGGFLSAADVPGWEDFVIRNSNSTNVAPVISDEPSGDKLYKITLGGQKAGWGTNRMNGLKVSDILAIGITRDPDVYGWGPYMNFWVTDGRGSYAVLSNEPSHTGEWTGSSAYATTWDVLKNATAWVYEGSTTAGFKLPNGTISYLASPVIAGTVSPHFTFNDFANYRIVTPSSHWGGTGAPDVLGASPYTAYSVNWVFGDTQTNYVGGYLVSNPYVVPEPCSFLLLILAALGALAYAWRRRQS